MRTYKNITWDELQKDTQKLAKQLRSAGKDWNSIVAITRGGLVPAAILAHELGLKIVETICISSYDDETKQARDMEVLKRFASEDDNIIVIDDLVDSGTTFDLVLSMVPNAYKVAVYAKPKGVSSIDAYTLDVPQDTWIVFPWEESKV